MDKRSDGLNDKNTDDKSRIDQLIRSSVNWSANCIYCRFETQKKSCSLPTFVRFLIKEQEKKKCQTAHNSPHFLHIYREGERLGILGGFWFFPLPQKGSDFLLGDWMFWQKNGFKIKPG